MKKICISLFAVFICATISCNNNSSENITTSSVQSSTKQYAEADATSILAQNWINVQLADFLTKNKSTSEMYPDALYADYLVTDEDLLLNKHIIYRGFLFDAEELINWKWNPSTHRFEGEQINYESSNEQNANVKVWINILDENTIEICNEKQTLGKFTKAGKSFSDYRSYLILGGDYKDENGNTISLKEDGTMTGISTYNYYDANYSEMPGFFDVNNPEKAINNIVNLSFKKYKTVEGESVEYHEPNDTYHYKITSDGVELYRLKPVDESEEVRTFEVASSPTYKFLKNK